MTTAEITRTSLRRRTVLAMAASAAGLACIGRAEAAAELVDLQIVDRKTGQPARVWRYAGRLFVAGRPGGRYSLRVTNNTAGRVLVVMSVDGVNILTGQTAGYDQKGYLFRPYKSYDVSGWRKSDTEVAAFTFAPLPRSYAARTGRPGDVGVIGVAAFVERAVAPVAVAPAAAPEARAQNDVDDLSEVVVTSSRSASSTSREAPPALQSGRGTRAADAAAPTARRSERLGTAHGGRERSDVMTVAFERATSHPQMVRRIEYDSYANLVAMGVIRPSPRPSFGPRPFPSSPDGYVPDPPRGR